MLEFMSEVILDSTISVFATEANLLLTPPLLDTHTQDSFHFLVFVNLICALEA